MALDEDTQKLKDMELSEGQTKIYNFTFIGTIETYEDLLDKEYQDQFDTFREKILDLFDIPYDKDLKTLNLEKDDEGQEEHQYKITCDYYLKTKMDPNKYINVEFEKIVEEEFFVGAIYYGFDLPIAPELIRWEGKFKRLHQKDYKKKRTFNNNKSGKGLSKDEIEQDKKRREVIKQKKEIEAANKRKRDSAKLEKMAEIQQEFADNHYQYDINNPNYKKMQEQGDDNKDDD